MSGRSRFATTLASACLLLSAEVAGADTDLPGEADHAAARGRVSYEQLCESCHGPEGKGDGPAGIAALPMPRDFSVGQFKFDADSDGRTGTDADLFLVIRDGGLAVGGSPLMAAWGHLGDDRVRDLVVYLRRLERAD